MKIQWNIKSKQFPVGLLIRTHFGVSSPVFSLGHQLHPGVIFVDAGCCRQHCCEDRWQHQLYTSRGSRTGKGWFQFRNPVLDLWGIEKMRLVLFWQQKPGPVLLHFQAGKVQKHLATAPHGVKRPRGLGGRLGVCRFLLWWPFPNVREATNTLSLIHASSFSVEGKTKSMMLLSWIGAETTKISPYLSKAKMKPPPY